MWRNITPAKFARHKTQTKVFLGGVTAATNTKRGGAVTHQKEKIPCGDANFHEPLLFGGETNLPERSLSQDYRITTRSDRPRAIVFEHEGVVSISQPVLREEVSPCRDRSPIGEKHHKRQRGFMTRQKRGACCDIYSHQRLGGGDGVNEPNTSCMSASSNS